MKVGFSFSPGGLLLPYHVGVISSLVYYNQLDDTTPIAGSSAGAIAIAAHSCNVNPLKVVDATINVSNTCQSVYGKARGNLLPLLNEQFEQLIDEESFEACQQRQGTVGVAYKEIFPRRKSYLQTSFDTRYDLFRAVNYSCMFPFFATKYPCILETKSKDISWLPRLMVDGFFSVPREQFGCPKFESSSGSGEDDDEDGDNDDSSIRTVAVSCFPKDKLRITAFDENDIICPNDDDDNNNVDLGYLFRIATESSSPKDLTQMYDNGFNDGEQWYWKQQERLRNAPIATNDDTSLLNLN